MLDSGAFLVSHLGVAIHPVLSWEETQLPLWRSLHALGLGRGALLSLYLTESIMNKCFVYVGWHSDLRFEVRILVSRMVLL